MSRFKLPLQVKLIVGFTLTLSLVSVSTYRWFFNLASGQLVRYNQAIVSDILTAALTGIDATDVQGLIQEGEVRTDGHSNDTRYWNLVSWLSLVASTNPESRICVFLPVEPAAAATPAEPDTFRPVGCSANQDVTFLAVNENPLQFSVEGLPDTPVSPELVRSRPTDSSVWMRGVQPIQDSRGNAIAYLGVALESSDLIRLQNNTLRYLQITFAATYLGLLLLTCGLAMVITRRVRILSQWAASVQQGDYSEKQGIPPAQLLGDELDDLAIAFQSMNEAIEYREAALKASEENLEAQVRDRTQQLSNLLRSESTVRSILANIQSSFSETEILQTAVDELGAKLPVLCVNTGSYNYEKGITTILTCYLNPDALDFPGIDNGRVGSVFLLDAWKVHQVLIAGGTVAFCPLDRDFPVAIFACPIEVQAASSAEVSLSSGQENGSHAESSPTLADIWLFKPAAETFDPNEIQLAMQVADVCAIAIRQAQLYRQTQERLTEVEAINRLKDDFLSTVSHELRTPITNMKMALQMLSMAMQASLDDRQSRYLTILKDEVAREAALINDLLDLQRLDAGGMGFSFEPVQLDAAISDLLSPFESRVDERQLHLEMQITPELPPVLTDVSAFKRILSELINNACKYTPSGERIVIAAHNSIQANHYVTVSVTNFGAVLPVGECDRIFDKFYRVPKSDIWKQGGTGLGLALVKGLMEHLNGAIAVESNLADHQPKYVRFSLEFPQFLPN